MVTCTAILFLMSEWVLQHDSVHPMYSRYRYHGFYLDQGLSLQFPHCFALHRQKTAASSQQTTISWDILKNEPGVLWKEVVTPSCSRLVLENAPVSSSVPHITALKESSLDLHFIEYFMDFLKFLNTFKLLNSISKNKNSTYLPEKT
jgi:hypothetical protein